MPPAGRVVLVSDHGLASTTVSTVLITGVQVLAITDAGTHGSAESGRGRESLAQAGSHRVRTRNWSFMPEEGDRRRPSC